MGLSGDVARSLACRDPLFFPNLERATGPARPDGTTRVRLPPGPATRASRPLRQAVRHRATVPPFPPCWQTGPLPSLTASRSIAPEREATVRRCAGGLAASSWHLLQTAGSPLEAGDVRRRVPRRTHEQAWYPSPMGRDLGRPDRWCLLGCAARFALRSLPVVWCIGMRTHRNT